ncbi:hypothetical protein D049_4343B, partial [Vibrio parahaemolyticus VPTS-2010]
EARNQDHVFLTVNNMQEAFVIKLNDVTR